MQPEVPSPPDWRQQQEVLQGVLGRQDWFQNVDMTNANPLLAQMCISYIEQGVFCKIGACNFKNYSYFNVHHLFYFPQFDKLTGVDIHTRVSVWGCIILFWRIITIHNNVYQASPTWQH